MAKFDNWDSKLLSMAGRAELIQIVMIPKVLYWLLVYHMPIATLLNVLSFSK